MIDDFAKPVPELDFSIRVFTRGFWPFHHNEDNLELPHNMSAARIMFEEWYKEQYNHRLLAWMYSLGDVIVHAVFTDRAYDVRLIPQQAVVLLLFNGDTVASFQYIQNQLRLNEDAGKRVLHSLSCGKHRVLLKSGHQRSIDVHGDIFRVNKRFVSRLSRFCVQMPSADGQAKTRINTDLQQQRGFNIDAT